MSRSLENTVNLSARWQDYLTTPARVWVWWWPKYWDPMTGLFPGATATLLALAAVVTGVALRDRRARMCLAMGVAGVILSFGPKTPLYGWLYHVYPPLHGIRGPARFGYLGIVAVAALAGFELAHLRAHSRAGWRIAISVAALVLVTAETVAAPIDLAPFTGIDPIYATIEDTPNAVVAELPLPHPYAGFINATYMLDSTLNWKPMINGYSGFMPQSYYAHYEALRSFPAPGAVTALGRMGVNRAFVHLNQLSPAQVQALAANPAVREIARHDTLALYAIAPPPISAPAPSSDPLAPRP